MKDRLINLIIQCDKKNANVISHKDMAPSSSIEEIAAYIDIFLAAYRQGAKTQI